MKYKASIVLDFFAEHGLPNPELEWRFHPTRKWKMDFAWVPTGANPHFDLLALEVQGGIFIQGRHSRGAALLKEWEKLNAAAVLGYRVLYCQPADLCTLATVDLIKRALGIEKQP